MKTIEDYLRMNYTMEVIEDPTEGGFVVSFPELPGCITCGQTLENALANALDAKKAWLEAGAVPYAVDAVRVCGDSRGAAADRRAG